MNVYITPPVLVYGRGEGVADRKRTAHEQIIQISKK